MKNEEFDIILEERIKRTKQVLADKCKEYSGSEGDKLHNFKVAAMKRGVTPEDALMGMKVKHDVSLDDIVKDLDQGILPNSKLLDEKIGDSINYLILLEALILERINKWEEAMGSLGEKE